MRNSYHVDYIDFSALVGTRCNRPFAMTAAVAVAGTSDEAARRAAARLIRIAGEALPPELAHLAEGSLAEALGKAVDYARHSISPTTEKIYADDWAAFSTWCAGHRAPYLPAAPAIVAAYLAERAATLGRSGLRVALAAIAYQHRRAGHIWTSGDPIIASVMKGILREQRRPVRPAAALTSEEIRRLLATCDADPESLASLRDRALLLTGFAGGLRRSELVALDHDDFRIDREGMRLRIRHSKADQEGEGAEVGIARFAPHLPGAGRRSMAARVPHHLRSGVPPPDLVGHHRGPAHRQRRVEDPAPKGRPGRARRARRRAAFAARLAGGLHHRSLPERCARRAGHGPRPPEGRRHHAALPQ